MAPDQNGTPSKPPDGSEPDSVLDDLGFGREQSDPPPPEPRHSVLEDLGFGRERSEPSPPEPEEALPRPPGWLRRRLLWLVLAGGVVLAPLLFVLCGGSDEDEADEGVDPLSGGSDLLLDEFHSDLESFLKVCGFDLDGSPGDIYLVSVYKPDGEVTTGSTPLNDSRDLKILIEVTGTGPGTYRAELANRTEGGARYEGTTEFGDSEGTEECA